MDDHDTPADGQLPTDLGPLSCVDSEELSKKLEQFAAHARRAQAPNPWALTAREAEVISAVCANGSYKAAARPLNLTPLSVKSAMRRIAAKMRLRWPPEAKLEAWRAWQRDQQSARLAAMPVAEIVNGVLRWHLPAGVSYVDNRWMRGTHLLYAVDGIG